MVEPLDAWLASAFTPANVEQTITSMRHAQPQPDADLALARWMSAFPRTCDGAQSDAGPLGDEREARSDPGSVLVLHPLPAALAMDTIPSSPTRSPMVRIRRISSRPGP
jgi:hypothetical protein